MTKQARPTSPTARAAQDLENLIRSGVPVIAVETWEEDPLTSAAWKIATRRRHDGTQDSKAVIHWSRIRGLYVATTRDISAEKAAQLAKEWGIPGAPQGTPPEHTDPLVALRWVEGWGQGKKTEGEPPPGAIFVFHDLHPELSAGEDSRRDFLVIRMIREVAATFAGQPTTLILSAPSWAMVPDLLKDVTVVTWPLPGESELREIVDDAYRSARAQAKAVTALTVDDSPEVVGAIVQGLKGLTAIEAQNVLSLALVTNYGLDTDALAVILEEKRAIVRKGGLLEFIDPGVDLGSVGGLANLKAYAAGVWDTFTPEARTFGVEPVRACIFVGPPGVGKSLTAKALAAAGRVPLLRLDMGALLGSLYGQSEGNVRRAIATAEAVAPCVLWIDEGEKAVAGMAGASEHTAVERRMLGTLLTWTQEHVSPVLVTMTANDVRAMPPELLDRFDSKWYLGLPDWTARVDILTIHLARRGRDPKALALELGKVAAAMDKFAGREIERTVVKAIDLTFRDGRRPLTTSDLLEVAAKARPLALTNPQLIKDLDDWAAQNAEPAAAPTSSAQSTAEAVAATPRRGRRSVDVN